MCLCSVWVDFPTKGENGKGVGQCCKPLIPALARQKQENLCEFEASLVGNSWYPFLEALSPLVVALVQTLPSGEHSQAVTPPQGGA